MAPRLLENLWTPGLWDAMHDIQALQYPMCLSEIPLTNNNAEHDYSVHLCYTVL